jgi:hypothetical protein
VLAVQRLQEWRGTYCLRSVAPLPKMICVIQYFDNANYFEGVFCDI